MTFGDVFLVTFVAALVICLAKLLFGRFEDER